MFWYFILYENIEIEYNTRIDTLKIKNDALKDDRDITIKENEKLTSWIKETPNTIPYFEKQLLNSKLKVDSLVELISRFDSQQINPKQIESVKKYSFF